MDPRTTILTCPTTALPRSVILSPPILRMLLGMIHICHTIRSRKGTGSNLERTARSDQDSHQRRRICQGISGFQGRFSQPSNPNYTRRKGHALLGGGNNEEEDPSRRHLMRTKSVVPSAGGWSPDPRDGAGWDPVGVLRSPDHGDDENSRTMEMMRSW